MEIDTSSYPKLPTTQQQNPLDTIAKMQGIQKNAIGIDQEKIKLYNEKYNVVHRALGNLVNEPELSGDHFVNTYQDMVKAGVMTPDQAAKEMSMVPTKAGSKSPEDYNRRLRQLAETQLLQAQEKHDAVTNYFGGQGTIQNGNQTITGNQGAIRPTGTGAGPAPFQQTGQSFPTQLPVGTPGVDKDPNSPNFGNPTFQGPATAPPPSIPPPGKGDRPPRLPIAPPLNGVNGPGEPKVGEPATPRERVAQGANTPINIAPSQPVQFESGRTALNEDLASGSARLQAIKQPQQALKMMTPEVLSGLTGTGPIGDKITKTISAVGGVLGLPKNLDDRVAARQEIVKKMNAYVSNSPVAGRSDAAQILAEASSPNPNQQSLKALVNLTRDAIALDRVHAAKSLDFALDEKGNQAKNLNYSEYPVKRGKFPNAVDEDAFKLDLMSREEREELQERKEKESPTAQQKFRTSVGIAKKLGMYN